MAATCEFVSHVFHDDNLEWEGLSLDVRVEVSADVSEPYSDHGKHCRGDVDRWYDPTIKSIEAWHDKGKLPKRVTGLILAHCHEEICEAVLAKIGDMDIDDALLRACGQ